MLLHWDGGAWEIRDDLGTAETLTGVWGSATSDVFVVGHKGLAWRYNGSAWSGLGTGTSENLYDVGRGPGGATYICGARGVVKRLESLAWVETPDTAMLYNSAGTASIDTLLRSRWDIASLTCITDYSISGSDGVVLMTDTRPTRWLLGPIGTPDWINAGQGSAAIADNFLATDTGKLFRLQLIFERFSWIEVSSPASEAVEAMWSDGLDSWFVTRTGKIIRRANDGSTLATVHQGILPLSGIWGSAASDIWACGYDGTMLHWDGAAWSPVSVPLPESGKSLSGPEADEYGRPLR